MNLSVIGDDWVPEACTLPTADRPLRRTEFDDLFARDVVSVIREAPLRLRLELRATPDTAARAADLAVKESGCCSFFAFDLSIRDGALSLVIGTAPAHEPVLAALTHRVETLTGAGA